MPTRELSQLTQLGATQGRQEKRCRHRWGRMGDTETRDAAGMEPGDAAHAAEHSGMRSDELDMPQDISKRIDWCLLRSEITSTGAQLREDMRNLNEWK